MTQYKPQRIIKLEARNVKRLRAVSIEPDGSVCIIGGQNAAGKSSVLDAIEMALAGGKSIPGKPLRDGTKKGKVVCETDDLRVTRSFTPSGGELTVMAKDGSKKLTSPQKVLNELIGSIGFDPLAFTREPPKKQLEIMKGLVGLDFTQHDIDRQAMFDNRTDVNRDAKRLESQLEGMPQHDDVPEKGVSASAILQRVEEANAHNADNDTVRQEHEDLAGAHREAIQYTHHAKTLIEDLEKQVEAAKGTLEVREKEEADIKAELDELAGRVAEFEDIDVSGIKAELEDVEETNRKVRENVMRASVADELATRNTQADGLTKKLTALDEKKQKEIAAAKFPVRGLGFDDDGVVTFNDIPFAQASSAEQLKVSVAMGITLNPTMRVMLIRDGSLLDEDSLTMIATMAEQHEFQVFIERVGDADPAAVVIEDGMVRGGDDGGAL